MGKAENIELNIIQTDNKTYNLDNTDEAINFLVYALNGKYSNLFIDFLLSHIGINIFKYSLEIKDNDSKSILDIYNDVSPFFDFFCIDNYEDNIFFKYIYTSNESDLIKKQKINNIVNGLKKTLDYYYDFHSVDIFQVAEFEQDYNFIDKTRKTSEFSISYIYFAVCKNLLSFYDYIYDNFYTFIDSSNEFDYKFSHKTKEDITNKKFKSNTPNRNEILDILFEKDIEKQKKFIKCEDKLISKNYLNDNKSKWLKGTSEFIRFYMLCEKNLLRKGMYEVNRKGVILFRHLYRFYDGDSIDFPKKRAKQITPTTKYEFDFLDF